jgi:hypothetical protein
MKDWGRRVCLGACAAMALLAMAPAASAKPGFYVSKPSRFELVHFKGSDGYAIDLFSLDAKRLVLLADHFSGFRGQSLAGESFGSQSVSYLVPLHGSRRNEIHASLGRLGSISLRFHASGPPKVRREPGDRCKGRDPTEQKGRFVGNFHFRGEQGFTSVRTSSANGQVLRGFKVVCKRPHEPRGGGGIAGKALSIGASVKGDPDKASFGAYQLESPSPRQPEYVTYSASVTEHRERMTITHAANAFAEPSTLTVSDPSASPTAATVAPPFPFSGTATLEHTLGAAPTWSGDLSVDLPGLGALPLTGPSFSASLCRKNLSCLCPPGRPCALMIAGRPQAGTRPLIRRVFAQDSGSHPQAFWDTRLSWSR